MSPARRRTLVLLLLGCAGLVLVSFLFAPRPTVSQLIVDATLLEILRGILIVLFLVLGLATWFGKVGDPGSRVCPSCGNEISGESSHSCPVCDAVLP